MASKHPDDRLGGYWASMIAFTAITALWAFVVREDDFYGETLLFGFNIPATTAFYLLTMPFMGFLVGSWRYQTSGGGNVSFLGKAVARSFNFVYSHLLIVLFTVAIATEHFLGWSMDNAIKSIDDSLFIVASRFAPWLAAYLAGFNLGRALGLSNWRRQNTVVAQADDSTNDHGRPSVTDAAIDTPARFDQRPGDNVAERRDPAFASLDGAGNNDRDLSETTPARRTDMSSFEGAHQDIGFRRDPTLDAPAQLIADANDSTGDPLFAGSSPDHARSASSNAAANAHQAGKRGKGKERAGKREQGAAIGGEYSKPAALADFHATAKADAQDRLAASIADVKRPSFERLR